MLVKAGRLEHLDPRKLKPPKHPRQHTPQSIEALKTSIMRLGVLQAIIVTHEGEDYRIVIGAGRAKACEELGIPVPAWVLSEQDAQRELEIIFHENQHRNDMSPVDKGKFIVAHMELSKGTQEDAAEALGIKPSYCSKLLTVNGRLTPELLEAVHTRKLDIGSAYEIARLPNPADQIELAGKVMQGLLKRASVTTKVREKLGGKKPKDKPIKARSPKGLVMHLPPLGADLLIAELQAVIEAIRKSVRNSLPLESLPNLLKQ